MRGCLYHRDEDAVSVRQHDRQKERPAYTILNE